MTGSECQQCRQQQSERCLRLRAELSDMATERGLLKQKLDAVGEQLHVVASDRRALEVAVLDQLIAMPPDVCIAPRLAGYVSRRNLEIRGGGQR